MPNRQRALFNNASNDCMGPAHWLPDFIVPVAAKTTLAPYYPSDHKTPHRPPTDSRLITVLPPLHRRQLRNLQTAQPSNRRTTIINIIALTSQPTIRKPLCRFYVICDRNSVHSYQLYRPNGLRSNPTLLRRQTATIKRTSETINHRLLPMVKHYTPSTPITLICCHRRRLTRHQPSSPQQTNYNQTEIITSRRRCISIMMRPLSYCQQHQFTTRRRRRLCSVQTERRKRQQTVFSAEQQQHQFDSQTQ